MRRRHHRRHHRCRLPVWVPAKGNRSSHSASGQTFSRRYRGLASNCKACLGNRTGTVCGLVLYPLRVPITCRVLPRAIQRWRDNGASRNKKLPVAQVQGKPRPHQKLVVANKVRSCRGNCNPSNRSNRSNRCKKDNRVGSHRRTSSLRKGRCNRECRTTPTASTLPVDNDTGRSMAVEWAEWAGAECSKAEWAGAECRWANLVITRREPWK